MARIVVVSGEEKGGKVARKGMKDIAVIKEKTDDER